MQVVSNNGSVYATLPDLSPPFFLFFPPGEGGGDQRAGTETSQSQASSQSKKHVIHYSPVWSGLIHAPARSRPIRCLAGPDRAAVHCTHTPQAQQSMDTLSLSPLHTQHNHTSLQEINNTKQNVQHSGR